MTTNLSTRILVLALLQLIVGGIVVLGGIALINFSVDAIGKALGIVHAILGVLGLSAGILLWIRKGRARTLTISANALIIAFSAASELVLSATNSLPSDQFVDSIIGTVAAIVIGAVVIIQLVRPDLKRRFGESADSTLDQKSPPGGE